MSSGVRVFFSSVLICAFGLSTLVSFKNYFSFRLSFSSSNFFCAQPLNFLFQLEFRKWGLVQIFCKDKCLNVNDNIYFVFIPFSQLPLFSNIAVPFVDTGAPPVSQSENFPYFPLPSQPANFCTVLDECAMRSYTELSMSLPDSKVLEHHNWTISCAAQLK